MTLSSEFNNDIDFNLFTELIGQVERVNEKQSFQYKVNQILLEYQQKQCSPHEWVDDGYDSHHSYAKCKKCGKTERDILIR